MALGALAATPIVLTACGALDDLIEPAAQLASDAQRAVIIATAAEIEATKVIPNSYIVTFRSDAEVRPFATYLTEYRAHYAPLVERFMADPRVVDINYIDHVDLASSVAQGFGADVAPPPSLSLTFEKGDAAPGTIAEVSFVSNDAAAEVLGEWEADGRVWFAEPNYASTLSGVFADAKTEYDANGGVAWHKQIKLTDAFAAMDALVQTVNFPVIAVLDSGLDVTHPSFVDRLWVNDKPGQSGCPGDTNGCDTTKPKKGQFGTGNVTPYALGADGKCPPQPPIGQKEAQADQHRNCTHGQHVAGIIAAKFGTVTGQLSEDGQGTPSGLLGGVCPVCKIMPIKIIAAVNGKGVASDAAILNGMKYITKFVANQRSIVRVVNSSFGKYSRSRAVSVIANVLAKSPNEVLIVGAASNEDSMQRTYPASLANAIAVSSVGNANQKASYSNYGPWVDVAAPGGAGAEGGVKIFSTFPGGVAGDKSGTSMACPVVSGVAGLALATEPNRSHRSLRQSIIRTADPVIYNPAADGSLPNADYYPKPQGDNTKRPLLGSGLVDAKAAVENKTNTGLTTGVANRVNQGCSTVAAGEGRSALGLLLFALLLPLAPLGRRLSHRLSRAS